MLLLLAVLVAALLVARSCGSSQGAISKEEAIEIAREQVSFEPEGVQVRNVGQGVSQRRIWAVSFYIGKPTRPERTTLVQVDAQSGRIIRVFQSGS